MSGGREAGREATRIQRLAADPHASRILRASAGSGKTKVLVDRILRLLLDGAPLKGILALTFTRKAAVEMKMRLLKAIRGLTTAEPEKRREILQELYGETPDTATVARAGRLFPQILEDAAGLPIGTIHTFCQTMLSRFADLAGLDPAFAILEKTDELWDETFRRLEQETARDPEAARELAALARKPRALSDTLAGLLNARLDLDRWSDHLADLADDPHGPRTGMLPLLRADLAAAIFAGTMLEGTGEPGPEDLAAPIAAAARELAGPGLDRVAAAGATMGDKGVAAIDRKRDELLTAAAALEAEGDADDFFDSIKGQVLTKSGGVRMITGAGRDKPAYQSALEDAVAPLLAFRSLLELIALFGTNRRLLRFGLRSLDIYDELKRRDGVLDFHDLERRAWRLVRDNELGPWIRYRLDRRLDHMLIDEFQDTNLNQWEILSVFDAELTSAAHDPPRTVFYVGDVKQSIYGFRGARPEIFGRRIAAMRERDEDAVQTLPTNFRSSPEVVAQVGRAFSRPVLAGRLPGPEEVEAAAQKAYREAPPGRVIIHPLFEGGDAEESRELAASRLAALIGEIVDGREVVEKDGPRPAGHGDILVLSRTRSHLAEYEDALRAAGIPFVPAGRGALARSREVQDVLMLLRWLGYPDDGIALASVLRSPLLRLTEDELTTLLARARVNHTSLWGALLSREDDPRAGLLRRWRGAAARMRMHDLLRLVYATTDAPERYALALGEQARYNLLRLHDLALEHDAGRFPTLRGFIRRIERAELQENEEEATLPESSSGRVRMMTIHKAKGLQAPFVILVDAGNPMRDVGERLVLDRIGGGDGPMVCGLRKSHRDRTFGDTPITMTAARARRRLEQEEANLLYVAMTRAEDELHVFGAKPVKTAGLPSHYDWLAEALPELVVEAPDGAAPGDRAVREIETDRYETWTPPPARARLEVRSPSQMIHEASDAPGGDHDRDAALARGTRIHRHLELAVEMGAMPPAPEPDDEAWHEAAAVLDNPDFEWIFRPGPDCEALCEAPILHRPAGEPDVRVLGSIDRLLIEPDRIVIIDYKSNRVGSGEIDRLVEHYRPQMAAYRDAMARVEPSRVIETYLLFTHPGGRDGRGILRKLEF